MVEPKTASDYINAIESSNDPHEILRLWTEVSNTVTTESSNEVATEMPETSKEWYEQEALKVVIEVHKACAQKIVKACQAIPGFVNGG